MSELVDLTPGAVFAGQFKVIRPLARGGMGAVYVVEQLGTARERALKLMHPQIAADAKSIERFEREAQISSKIDSDHVVEVIAAGVDEKTATPWLCMELLLGETLADRIETRGRLSREETLQVMSQLGHALAAAHRARIVHRDLKPENLFLATPRREGIPFTLKVLDFGVAALVADTQNAKTTQGIGSPMWMAPEQTDVGHVSTSTDVWALGLIAFYLLTGKLYWKSPNTEGSSITALLVEMMVDDMPLASERATELLVGGLLPPGFDAWFAHAVQRDPSKRFPDAGAAVPELVAILEREPVDPHAPTLPTPSARPAVTAPSVAPSSGAWKYGAAALGVLAICAIGALGMDWTTPAPATTVPPAAPPPTMAAQPIPTTTVPAVAADDTADDDEDDAADEDDTDEDESDQDDDTDEDDGEDEAPSPAPAAARIAPPSASAAAARRMLLDSCWRTSFDGQTAPAPARWTFDFTLALNGAGSNVRITGPSEGAAADFRRCVVMHVADYHPTDGATHVSLTLP